MWSKKIVFSVITAGLAKFTRLTSSRTDSSPLLSPCGKTSPIVAPAKPSLHCTKKWSCNGRFKVFVRWVNLQVWGDCSLWVTMWITFDSPIALAGGVGEQIFVYSLFLFLISRYLARSLVTTHFTLHWCIWQMWVLRKAASACKGCCLKQTPSPNKCYLFWQSSSAFVVCCYDVEEHTGSVSPQPRTSRTPNVHLTTRQYRPLYCQ